MEVSQHIKYFCEFCGKACRFHLSILRFNASSFNSEILAYQGSGIKLGTYKFIKESLTCVAVYVSLLTLYCLEVTKFKRILRKFLNRIHKR
ncbi:hypothetical protein RND81_08G051800 [Saponaria officinalis]|uniref:Uncharacterized protein n=1 Tax=Saponaria officinalis TaxID=3572 RepID=A0AAW1J3P9_SAPOF